MDEQEGGWFQGFLIWAIVVTVLIVPCWALIWRNTVNEPPAIVIGQEAPAVATPDPVFMLLIEKARAEARSQATDDEIKLRWEIHHMRRFWAWYALAPAIFILAGGTVALVAWLRWGSSS